MSPEQQRITIAGACGNIGHLHDLPDYLNDLNAMHKALETITGDTNLRVKFLNALRKIVGNKCEVNKVGLPIVSDFDLIHATAAEKAKAFILAKNLNRNENNI
jgi:hypothetical protein